MGSGRRWGSDTIGAACSQFGIGAPIQEEILDGGGSADDVLRVETAEGAFVLKLLDPSPPDWRVEDEARADRVESAALAAGVRGAERLRTVDGGVVASVRGARLLGHRWIDGRPAVEVESTPALCEQVGRMLGQIHGLVEGGATTTATPGAVRFDPVEWWARTTDEAAALGRPWADDFRDLAGRIAELEDDLHQLVRAARPMVLSHRDISPRNVIVDRSRTAFLIDWASAGPVRASSELAAVEEAFAGGAAHLVEALRHGYLHARGGLPAVDALDLSLVLEAKVGSVAWNAWRALGHRGDDQREAGGESLPGALAALREHVKSEVGTAAGVRPEQRTPADAAELILRRCFPVRSRVSCRVTSLKTWVAFVDIGSVVPGSIDHIDVDHDLVVGERFDAVVSGVIGGLPQVRLSARSEHLATMHEAGAIPEWLVGPVSSDMNELFAHLLRRGAA